MSEFKPCDHKRNYNDVEIVQIGGVSLKTPASESAHSCCIRCIKKYSKCLKIITNKPMPPLYTNWRDVAKTEILRNVIWAPIPMWYKFPTIIWCLKQGFRYGYIFNNYYLFSSDQLAQLVQFGVFPDHADLDAYVFAGMWKEIKTIRANLPVKYRDDCEKKRINDYRIHLDDLIFLNNELNKYLYHDIINIIMGYSE